MVDLAGSEGESAFTPEFVKKVDPPTLMARRLEAGCINTGLSQLQVVFNELKVKGKLTKSKGTGLRRILHAYINQNCMISVMFTLSPAFTNRTTTESTLKFAVQAGMVKVKPVKAKAQVNFKALVADLQKHVKEQEELIEKLNDDIEKLNDEKHDLTFKVSRLEEKLEYAQSSGGGGGDNDGDNDGKKKGVKFSEEDEAKAKEVEDQRRALQKRGFKRTKTIMPDKLQSQLLLLNDVQDDDEDEDGYQLSLDDQKSCVANNISAAKVDSDIQRIHNRRKTAAIDTNLLNAAIRRSTTMSNLSLTVDKLGALPDGNEEKETNPKNKVETPTPATYDIDDDNPDNIPAFADTERQQTIKQTMIGASNIFDVAQNEAGDEEDEDPDFMTFETKDTANMTQDELVDYCDQLESKLIEEKTLRYGLQKSQQVIIDHLMETNEALLQWFKIKKIL